MRLIDANEPINAFKRYAKNHPNATWNAFGIEEVINAANTVDAVEVVQIERLKQEILQQMDMFIAEYNRIGFYGKSDTMDIARRLVNASLTDLCFNCGAKMDGGNEDGIQ